MTPLAEKPGKPGAPVYADIKDGRIPMTWTAPLNDGGAEIINYVLEQRVEGLFQWKRVTETTITELAYTAKGLNTDDVYEFRVAAENKAGVGPFSESSTPVKAKEPIGKRHETMYSARDLQTKMLFELSSKVFLLFG